LPLNLHRSGLPVGALLRLLKLSVCRGSGTRPLQATNGSACMKEARPISCNSRMHDIDTMRVTGLPLGAHYFNLPPVAGTTVQDTVLVIRNAVCKADLCLESQACWAARGLSATWDIHGTSSESLCVTVID
jgi:hypothetical protein